MALPAHMMGDEPEIAADVSLAMHTDGRIPERAQSWRPDNDRAAEWAMRKLAELHGTLDKIEEQRAQYEREINEWAADARKQYEQSQRFFEGVLKNYAMRNRLNGGPATLKLPSGYVATRIPKTPRVQIHDVEVVAAWAQEALPIDLRDRVVKVETKVLVSELSKYVTVADDKVIDPKTGEPVPGVETHWDEPTATVTVTGA